MSLAGRRILTPTTLNSGRLLAVRLTATPSHGLALWSLLVDQSAETPAAVEQKLYNDLIAGLKADGVWPLLDRIFVLAAENTQSALTSLKAPTSTAATAVSPSFTTDRGYTGNGSSAYVNSNFDPSVGTNNYTRDSACLFAWSNTSGQQDGGLVGHGFGTPGAGTRLNTLYFDNNCRWDINDSVNVSADPSSGATWPLPHEQDGGFCQFIGYQWRASLYLYCCVGRNLHSDGIPGPLRGGRWRLEFGAMLLLWNGRCAV